jgi:hypothetical protein
MIALADYTSQGCLVQKHVKVVPSGTKNPQDCLWHLDNLQHPSIQNLIHQSVNAVVHNQNDSEYI